MIKSDENAVQAGFLNMREGIDLDPFSFLCDGGDACARWISLKHDLDVSMQARFLNMREGIDLDPFSFLQNYSLLVQQ